MIRYKLRLFSVLTLSLFFLSGCATKPTVFSDFDGRHDFTKDRTFSWVQDPPMLKSGNYTISVIAVTRMTAAIKNEFIKKGYEFVETPEKADFAVTYTMGARDKIELDDYPDIYYGRYTNWGWGYYYFPYFVHVPFDRYGSRHRNRLPYAYTQGSIAIDIFNTKTKQPIWHSKASKRLSSKDLNSNLNNATEVAMRLLQNFPLIGCEPVITDQCKPF